ncbi:hypothetical protein T03_9728 [Trichinella britovi]|uniref:Uncharacterized protein n=1 Tax=Trichinella britovi TaxID=45882 RepID=A0A0V1CAM9_TRIBR|nr:hypothetical protein T03_9728 [Trichinella britovi]
MSGQMSEYQQISRTEFTTGILLISHGSERIVKLIESNPVIVEQIVRKMSKMQKIKSTKQDHLKYSGNG